MTTTPQPSVTSEMVERVAKALCNDGYAPDTWDNMDEAIRGNWRWVARVAVTAMREPTIAMLDAGHSSSTSVRLAGVLRIWQGMIDAALANPQTPSVSSEDGK